MNVVTKIDRIVPPGISESDFEKAIAAMRKVVGDKAVITDGAGLGRYLDPYSLVDDDRFTPSAAVLPGSTEDVQAIMKIANEYRIPVSPISTGKNNGYGGGAPRLRGAIVLDLGTRMNKIIEVSEKYGYALVEPGVSYFDLDKYLRANNIKLWIDTPDLGWGSIIGNTMDRGVGYTPYGDHLMMQCGMEVVFADGDVMRTGMGAMPGNDTWQLFKYGFGPVQDPLFTQSNYGIVTKMGIWLMPEPPGYEPYMITFPREEDLQPLVEILRPLRLNMIIQNVPSLRNVLLDAATVENKRYYYDGDGPCPDSVLKKIMADQDLGFWNFYGASYGPPPLINMTYSVVQDAFSNIPGAKFYKLADRPGRNGHVLQDRAKIMGGVPSLDELKLCEWTGDNGGHVCFSPVSAPDGEDAMKQYVMVRDRFHEFGFDYIATFIIGWREMHHVCLAVYQNAKPEDRKKALELCKVLIKDAAAAGYGEYRTHIALMDDVAATFNFNDNAMMRFNEKIKDALDPNGIIAPGKSGIWPKHMRGQK
jgi:4-cresol dehydrogenase (hydroxylating)